MKNKIFLLLFATLYLSAFASKDNPQLAVSLISENLVKGANAIVRNYQLEFTYENLKNGIQRVRQEVTVLNEQGLNNANFSLYGDRFRKLKRFSAVTYDFEGKRIKRYKMADVNKTEWSAYLGSDNIIYYFDCPTPTFPFSIVYEYEVEWRKGIHRFPVFQPQDNSDLSVEQATYTLIAPLDTKILYRGTCSFTEPDIRTKNNIQEYVWCTQNLMPLPSEPFLPDIEDITPRLYAAPETFLFDNYEGSFASLKNVGNFQRKLNERRNTLTDEMKLKIEKLTCDAKTEREKVKILYDYLGSSTRYESIQLGIGGYQPMTSGDVCKSAFGDCKGLSFYLKSMLESIGIPANYTIIRSDALRKRLRNDFTAYLESNHVILQVPLPGDTLWLECTSDKVPFGFIHNQIAGHHAIVIAPSETQFVQLPDYPDSTNVSCNTVKVLFGTDGNAEIKVTNYNTLKRYNEFIGFNSLKENEKIDGIRKKIQLPKATVSQLQVEEIDTAHPAIILNYNINASPYGANTGNRFFVPLNVFRTNNFNLRKQKRINDIRIANGWRDRDDIEIVLPEGITIEYLPPPVVIESSFGYFHSKVLQNENRIKIQQDFLLKSGIWSACEYRDFYNFIDKLYNIYKDEIVLKKE